VPGFPADIETVPFADGCIARNLKSGALCRLNATATGIVQWYVAGMSEAEAAIRLDELYGIGPAQAAGDVSAILQALRQSGLLPGETAEPEAGTAGSPESRNVSEEETGPETAAIFQAALDVCVSCGGAPVRVRCEEAELAGLLEEVLAPALAEEDAAVKADATLSLTGQEGDFRCWRDGALQWRAEPRPLARRLFLQDIITGSLPADRLSAILHASAIVIDGHAVVLAGNSGSGKSTLTAGLIAAGGKLVADDLLPLGVAAEGVWPVPFSISVKQGSWAVLSPLFAGFDSLRTLTSRGMKVRYLAAGMAMPAQPVKPSIVVFPTWNAKTGQASDRLSDVEIADRLIETGTDLAGAQGALAEFAEFASSVKGFRIEYPTLRDGVSCVRDLVGKR